MSDWQLWLWLGVIFQRLLELVLAQYNAKWIKEQGGYEVGKRHYPLFVLLHGLFFIAIGLEGDQAPSWWMIPFLFFVAAQLLRIWTILSLGRFWNTRIWVLPNRLAPVRVPIVTFAIPTILW